MDPIPENVAARREAEDKPGASELRFRRYFELGLIGMAITSPSKGILEVNDEICRILGYGRDELLKMTWPEITHPEDVAADVINFARVMSGEVDGYAIDKRWIRKDGRIIDTTISVKCVRSEDGSVDYFVALLDDITERKQAEGALRESEERLDLALRASNIGIWENHMPTGDLLSSRVELINILEPLGYLPSEITHRHTAMMELVHPEHRERVEREAQAYLADGKGDFEIEHPMRHKDGSYRCVLCRGIVLRDAAGTPRRFTGTLLDITERKQKALRQQALAAAALKINASLSVAGPLNAIMQLLTDQARQIIGAHVAVSGVTRREGLSQSMVLVSLSEEYRQSAEHAEPFSGV